MSPEQTAVPYEMALEVQPSDIDQLGHVNNVVYVRWVQDAAVAHWTALTTTAQRAKVAWVAVRHEIDFKRPAYPADPIIARTWVGPASALAFERHTEILHARDRRLLARARTLWCPIDPASGKPCRVSADVRALVSVPVDGTQRAADQ